MVRQTTDRGKTTTMYRKSYPLIKPLRSARKNHNTQTKLVRKAKPKDLKNFVIIMILYHKVSKLSILFAEKILFSQKLFSK